METIERILSFPTAKPYRTGALHEKQGKPLLDGNGLLDFSPGDIENPKNWSKPRRWYITIVCVLLVVNATFASTSPSGVLHGIAEEFHVSTEPSGLVITVFLLGYAFGPLFWAPLSEFFGRRWIFYISFTGYLVFTFLCAFANGFAALLVGRFLTGMFSSAPLTNAPGVLADLWPPVERGIAIALFACMNFAGPGLGPVVGGFLELKKSWRWDFYALLWFAGITEALMFTIPETLPAVVLQKKAERLRRLKIPGYEDVKAPNEATDRTLLDVYKVALTRPWQILLDPISFLAAIYLSFVYMLLFMLFSIYPIVFQQKRGWNSGVGELPLIGIVLGAIMGSSAVVYTSLTGEKIEKGYKSVPEDRLLLAMVGGVLLPVTMFWFAWTAEYDSIHWIVPTIAGTFLSASFILIFVSYLNYIIDTYLMAAASAVAANTIVRTLCGAVAPLFTRYLFENLGVGGAGSLIGGIATLLAPIPFVFYKYGGLIRERSKFTPKMSKPVGAHQEVPRVQNVAPGAEGATLGGVERRQDFKLLDGRWN